MRMSLGMNSLLGATIIRPVYSRRRAYGSAQPEPLSHQALHLSPVRAPLGLAHHRADDRAHRLGLAGADLLHRVGVLLDRAADDRLELVGGREAEAALLDDRGGGGYRARAQHADELGERLGRDRRLGGVAFPHAADELDGDPACEGAGIERGARAIAAPDGAALSPPAASAAS